jgi:hypothetical protein
MALAKLAELWQSDIWYLLTVEKVVTDGPQQSFSKDWTEDETETCTDDVRSILCSLAQKMGIPKAGRDVDAYDRPCMASLLVFNSPF